MNLIKRLKAPTPKKYLVWGKITKNISLSLGAGLAAAAVVSLPAMFLTVMGIVVFTTSAISTYCYAQIEEDKGEKNV